MSRSIILVLLAFFAPGCLFAGGGTKTDTLYLHYDRPDDDAVKGLRFDINYGRDNEVLWRVHKGDNISFADPAFADEDWMRSRSLLPIDTSNKNTEGISWFRLRVVADSSAINRPHTFVFKGMGAMEVYLDGRLMGRVGRFQKGNNKEYLRLVSTPVYISLTEGAHVLAVRYENNDARQQEEETWGFSLSAKNAFEFFLNTKGNMLLSSIMLIGIGTVFFTLFVVHFLLFIFYRKEISNLYFALFTLSVSLLLFLVYYSFNAVSDFSNSDGYMILLALSCIVSCFALSAFTEQLFSKRKVFLKIIMALSLATLALSIVDIYAKTAYSDKILAVLLVFAIGNTIVRVFIAMFRKIPGALILGTGVLFFTLFFLVIIVYVLINESIYLNTSILFLLVLAIFSLPISISSFLAWRFSSTSKNLGKQLITVENLSLEKQAILEHQKEKLEEEVKVRTEEIVREKQKSDDLLLNILPAEIAEELKAKGESKAQLYSEATVLFTDFVNFTRMSEQLGVEELLNELNINFTAFDKIMEKHGLEKIKTIGDAYLAVSGLPVSNHDHARNTILAALDIIRFVTARKEQVPYGLDIRIGVNSGSLIAGIIGVKKFAYDIWGDTVNIAARMEQSSEAGKINISEHTYRLVKDEFTCLHRGKIGAKHKGEMDMYFVEEPNQNNN